jgi:hypothetical protein
MSFLRQWLLGIVGCALVISLAQRACTNESMRAVMRFAGGLTLVLCLVQPLRGAAADALLPDIGAYRAEAAQRESELRVQYEAALSESIAQRTDEYIEAEAQRHGLAVRAEVRVQSVDGVLQPVQTTLHGPYSAALAEWIEATLGITEEAQQWTANG